MIPIAPIFRNFTMASFPPAVDLYAASTVEPLYFLSILISRIMKEWDRRILSDTSGD